MPSNAAAPIVTSGQMVIPTNTNVLIRGTSRDVIHSFWVPEAQRQARHGARAASTRGASRPTSPASTPASAPSSAGSATPTCAWRSSPSTRPTTRRGSTTSSSRTPRPDDGHARRSRRGDVHRQVLAAATRSTGSTNADGEPVIAGTRPVGVRRCRSQPHQPDDPQHVRRRARGTCSPRTAARRCGTRRPRSSVPPTCKGVTPECLNQIDLEEWLRDAPGKKPMYADPTSSRRRTGSTGACPTSACPRTRSTSWSPISWSGSDRTMALIERPAPRALVPAVATPSMPPTACSGARSQTTGWKSWVFTIDHKKIGIMYGATALFFFLVGGIEALLIRAQLAGNGRQASSRPTSTTRCSRCTPPR